MDAFGSKSSGVVGGSTGGTVVVNDSAEGTDALCQGLEDEFATFDGETVCVVEVIFRRNGVAAETVVTDCRSRRGNFLNLEGGLTCTLAEQYGGVGGNLFRIQLCERDHAVLCIDFSAIYINIRRYFNCGGGEEGDVAEFVGAECELRGFFEEEVAVRFVGSEAESAGAVEFHELVTHFEAVAAGIEGLFELTLRDNGCLCAGREIVLGFSESKTVVNSGKVLSVEVEHGGFALIFRERIAHSRGFQVFRGLRGTGGSVNVNLCSECFCVCTNSIFILRFGRDNNKGTTFREIEFQCILNGLHFFHFTGSSAIAYIRVSLQKQIISGIVEISNSGYRILAYTCPKETIGTVPCSHSVGLEKRQSLPHFFRIERYFCVRGSVRIDNLDDCVGGRRGLESEFSRDVA